MQDESRCFVEIAKIFSLKCYVVTFILISSKNYVVLNTLRLAKLTDLGFANSFKRSVSCLSLENFARFHYENARVHQLLSYPLFVPLIRAFLWNY
jgi:hypothetical protein